MCAAALSVTCTRGGQQGEPFDAGQTGRGRGAADDTSGSERDGDDDDRSGDEHEERDGRKRGGRDSAEGGAGGGAAGSGGSGDSLSVSGAGGSVAGSAASGGSSAGGGGAGGTAVLVTQPNLDDCSGIVLDADGVLDVDLQAIQIAGNVTLAGAPLPDEANHRGWIVFADAEQGARVRASLESRGEASYTLTLPPGTYDVVFEPNPELCAVEALPEMPCGGGRLLSGVSLQGDGVLDIDIPVVSVSGAVTLNGDSFPNDRAERGHLQFVGEGGTVVTGPFGRTGDVSYALTLVPDTYDVLFVGNPELCLSSEPSNVPCNSGIVLTGVALNADGALDVDVPAVSVAGSVTLSGEALPDEGVSRGAVTLVGEELSPATSLGFGAAGPAAYGMTLLPGTYAVHFAGNPELCTRETASQVPCNGGRVVSAVSLRADGVLDVDLTPASISGNVTLNGAAFPSEGGDRGWLNVSRSDGGQVLSDSFGASGAVSYEMTLLAGTYDISYVPNPALCTATDAPQAPCNGSTLLSGIELTADGALDVDVPSVRVVGNVTVNGAPMGTEATDRGTLLFALEGGGAVTLPPFGASGEYRYETSLIPGAYAVSLAAAQTLCDGEATPGMPCISGTLIPSVDLKADGALDVDVPAIQLTGTATLEGEALPDELASRGAIRFFLLGDKTSATGGSLRDAGDGTYRITLLPGAYTVIHQATEELCGTDGPPPDVPCASQTLVGCD